uniref:BHLH domain-containing protein n=1 Tax=Leersia perrieri TaxID=77586 RepID=A0A0D9UYC0_9ORYZ
MLLALSVIVLGSWICMSFCLVDRLLPGDEMGSAPFGNAAGELYEYQGYHGGFAGGAVAAAASMEMTKKNFGKGGGDRDEKAAMALKSHSEAERRRRERINAHLATLRTMVPSTDKMDKAALLAEVVSHVRKLKVAAARVGGGVPSGADEVAVEETTTTNTTNLIRATLSCDDRSDLFADVKLALQPLGLEVVGSEVTTIGGRVRLAFHVSKRDGASADVVASVRHALQSVLDKASSGFDAFAPRASLLSKRRKVSTFESSTSSS